MMKDTAARVDGVGPTAYRHLMYAPKTILVEGFKSIQKQELSLRPLNVLIGANGAGKSNFISLFNLVSAIAQENLQTYVARQGGADALLYFGSKTTSQIVLDLKFAQNRYRAILTPSADDHLFFEREDCWGYSYRFTDYQVPLGRGHYESNLPKEVKAGKGKISAHVLDAMKSWKVYHFHDTSPNAKVKLTGDIEDNRGLRADAANLAAFLYFLHEQRREYYDQIVETVRLAAPFFHDFALQPSQLKPDGIRLEWRERGSDAYFDANALSDGTLRFICLATLLLQPGVPETIVIDEPELGLHPYAISLLAGMLRAAAVRGHVIVSTQSVPLVNQFTPEDVVVVEREEGQSVFKRLPAEGFQDWLDEYGLGDLWEKNLLGGRPSR